MKAVFSSSKMSERTRDHDVLVDAMHPGPAHFAPINPHAGETPQDRLARLEKEYLDDVINGPRASHNPRLVAIIAARAAVYG